MYSPLQVAKIDPHDEKFKSLEWSICGIAGDSDPPAVQGDSGSLIFRTVQRDVVGMLTTGWVFNKVAYFTRIDDLSRDILSRTEAKDIRMYGA